MHRDRCCRCYSKVINNARWRCLKLAQAYCVKCKAKKEIVNPKEKVAKNGRPMLQGTCPDCGGKLSLFIKK
ncbi:MAG: DUF5679 domain-containing protein [Coriobacteriales bacterium]